MNNAELALRLDFLDAQILALRSLVITQMEVLEARMPGFAQATTKGAEVHRDAVLMAGEPIWAQAIETILDELRQRFPSSPAND